MPTPNSTCMCFSQRPATPWTQSGFAFKRTSELHERSYPLELGTAEQPPSTLQLVGRAHLPSYLPERHCGLKLDYQ